MVEKTYRQDESKPLGVGEASKSGNTRTAGSEQFYTPVDQASTLLSELQKALPEEEWRGAHWIEPSGGTGAFIDALLKSGVQERDITSFDIEPKHRLVKKANFLDHSTRIPELEDGRTIIAIGNPPFGRNSSLSVPFFNKLVKEGVNHIGFIIPKSWRKWSIERRLDSSAHKVFDLDLKVDYVNDDGSPARESTGSLATVFQIWSVNSEIPPRVKTRVVDRSLIRRVKPAEADLAMVIFGYSCGKLLWDGDFDRTRSVTTTTYLKVPSQTVREALKRIEKDEKYKKFSKNVAFVEALSLEEINYLIYEELGLNPWRIEPGETLPDDGGTGPIELSEIGGFKEMDLS